MRKIVLALLFIFCITTSSFAADVKGSVTDLVVKSLTTTGGIKGGIPLLGTWAAPITTASYTLTPANTYGSMLFYGATDTVNLPTAVAGMNIIIMNTGAFTITIDPNGTDVIVLKGTVLSGGQAITLASGAGNQVFLVADAANHWIVPSSNTESTVTAGS
jgi:hypothetical protein